MKVNAECQHVAAIAKQVGFCRGKALTMCSSSPTSSSLSVLFAMTLRPTSSRRALLVMRRVRAACRCGALPEDPFEVLCLWQHRQGGPWELGKTL